MPSAVPASPSTETMERFTAQLRELQARLARLLPLARPGQAETGTVLAALSELNVTVEELQAADEALRHHLDAFDSARAALDKERRYYVELFDSAPDAYLVTDAQGQVSAANQAAGRLLNRLPGGLVGRPLLLYFAAGSRAGLRQRLQHLREDGEPLAWEDQLQPRGRPPIEVSVRVFPRSGAGGGAPELRWRFYDMAAWRQSEQARRDSEERYHRLVHASLEAIYLYESYSRRVLEANPAFLRLLGYTAGEVEQLTVYDIAGHARTSIDEKLQQIMAGGPVDLGERRWRHKDGRLIDVQVTASRIQQGDRDIIAIIGRDISAQKAAEARLRESEARFRRLAENAPDIIYRYRLQPNPAYEYISPAVTRLLGYTPEDFYKDPLLGLRQTHPDDRETMWAVTNHPATASRPQIVRRTARDGRLVWTEQRTVVLYDEHDVPVAVEGIIRDITTQQQAMEENRRLFEAEREQRALAEALRRTAEVLNRTLDFSQVLDQILDHAQSLVRFDLVVITLVEGDGRLNNVRSRGHKALGLPDLAAWPSYALSDFPLLAEVSGTGQPLAVPDTATFPGWVVKPETAWMRSQVMAPLRMKTHVTGFISATSRTPNFYTGADAPRLQALADQAAVALENAMLFQQLQHNRQQLQDLSQRLLAVQETERRVMARELHDEIGQALTGLKLFLEAGRSSGDTARAKLDLARDLVEDLISRVRDLALDLRPTMLDDLGLVPALLWQIERYTAQTGVHVNFQHFGLNRRFHPDLETAAYRIVQEALTNVARHAGVKSAAVNLWTDAAHLNVQVEDAGHGFDKEQARAANASSGLAGMRERASLLQGQLNIEAAPGAGTQITAELPLRAEAPALHEPA